MDSWLLYFEINEIATDQFLLRFINLYYLSKNYGIIFTHKLLYIFDKSVKRLTQ